MAYSFQSSVADPDSFINMYIRYASKLTDASHDFHEAMALYLLSIVASGMKLPLPSMPAGLRPNLYIILYGISSHARKSTCMDIAKDILKAAAPGLVLPASFTPGGLEEAVASRNYAPSALFADEFSRVLDQMHNQSFMSGLRQFLLTMYSSESWDYRRTSKGSGAKKQVDEVRIDGAHLCLAGNVTPTISKYLQPRDIEDGFLARFAVIYPEDKPARKKIGDLTVDRDGREELFMYLSRIYQACQKIGRAWRERDDVPPPVAIDDDAIEILDGLQAEIEGTQGTFETQTIMMERIGVMAFKVAILVALSRCDPSKMQTLQVTRDDALAAVSIAKKWGSWASRFAGSLYENDVDKYIRRAQLWLLESEDNKTPRYVIAKKMRLTKKALDEVQMTMLDRGLITLVEERVGESRKTTLFWKLIDQYDE